MAILSYPTDSKISAPLLVDGDRLLALDQIIDQYLGKLKLDSEQRATARVARELTAAASPATDKAIREVMERAREMTLALYGAEKRSVAIYLRGGKTITSDRFADALALPPVRDEFAVGFRHDLRVGETNASVSLISESLDISVEPNDSAVAQELYGAILNWASDFAPPFWQRLWHQLAPVANIFFFVWLLAGLVLLLVPFQQHGKNMYQAEAQQILKQGISPTNQSRALELVLAIVSDYTPEGRAFHPGLRTWEYYVAGILILGVFRTCPGVVVGIGKGKSNLKFWRLWIKLAWVTIPGLIFTSIVLPRIISYFNI